MPMRSRCFGAISVDDAAGCILGTAALRAPSSARETGGQAGGWIAFGRLGNAVETRFGPELA